MRLPLFGTTQAVSLAMLALLLIVGLLWVWHIVGMQEDSAMESCLLTGGRLMLCALSGPAQIGLWQEMFAVVLPLRGALLILATVLLAVGSTAGARLLLGDNPSPLHQRLRHRFRDWLPREPLREEFSQGILHPKIYESALL